MMDSLKKLSGEKMLNIISRLENGEKVSCPLCEKGVLKPIDEGSRKNSCYECDSCSEKLNID